MFLKFSSCSFYIRLDKKGPFLRATLLTQNRTFYDGFHRPFFFINVIVIIIIIIIIVDTLAAVTGAIASRPMEVKIRNIEFVPAYMESTASGTEEEMAALKADAEDEEKDKDGVAACALGSAFEEGIGPLLADDVSAVKWYEVAVKRGNLAALNILACRELEAGRLEKAREMFEDAAKKGLDDGMWHLALMCRDGLGGPVDFKRAFTLAETAAREHQNAMAWNVLGTLYENGQGHARSPMNAKSCYRMSGKLGFESGLQNYQRMRGERI